MIIHASPIAITGKNIQCHVQCSFINNLCDETENIWKGLTKTLRYEIKRSEKEAVRVEFINSVNLLENGNTVLHDFSVMYRNMYLSKGMHAHIGMGELMGYAKSGNLIVSVAYIDETPAVYHSYVFDETHCRLLHSCSLFREEEKEMQNAIGRANKYLHWRDILFFKEMGIIQYDWGGVSSFDNMNGIDTFKMAFGGEAVTYYNIHIACSMKQRIRKGICDHENNV